MFDRKFLQKTFDQTKGGALKAMENSFKFLLAKPPGVFPELRLEDLEALSLKPNQEIQWATVSSIQVGPVLIATYPFP